MNSINRLLVSLVALFLVVSAVVTALVAAGALDYRFLPGERALYDVSGGWFAYAALDESVPYEVSGESAPYNISGELFPYDISGSWFESELRGLAELGWVGKTVSIASALAVIALALVLLALQVKAGMQRGARPLLVSSSELGVFNIDPASVRLLAETTGAYNRNVVDLRCNIHLPRKTVPPGPARIVIYCHPLIVLGADVQEVRDDLQARIKEVVERLSGLEVERVNVTRARYDQGQEDRLIE